MKNEVFLVAMVFAMFCMAGTNSTETITQGEGVSPQKTQSPISVAIIVTNSSPSCSASAEEISRVGWLEQRVDTAEKNLADCYEGLKARVRGNVSREIRIAKAEAENEYAKRYQELKNEQERFLVWLTIFVAGIGIGVSILTHKDVKNSKVDLHNEFEKYNNKVEQSMEGKFHQARAEMFFQVAKANFEQYKLKASATILEIVVKELSHCVESGVAAKNGERLTRSISFLAYVMIDAPDAKQPFSTDLERDRKIVAKRLSTWDWQFDINDVKDIMEKDNVEKDKIDKSISNLRAIFDLCS